jgi:serine/threonine protein kinase
VYDAGFWPTGEPYLVMKHVLGQSLEKVIAEAETFADRLALLPHVIAVADALAYAHDQGIIHRDLKPGNVIVGAFGETVVIDWGLAKDLRAADAADPDLVPSLPRPAPGTGITEAGSVLGTPPYMPPEQAAGEAVDARADVYALGAMLYHVLAGAPPHPDSQRGRTTAQAPRDYQPPVPLARAEPNVPSDLAAIVSKAMAADRGARYLSAFELGEDLKRFQTGQLVAAHRYSVVGRVSRWIGRHPAVTVAALVAAAILAGRQCAL